MNGGNAHSSRKLRESGSSSKNVQPPFLNLQLSQLGVPPDNTKHYVPPTGTRDLISNGNQAFAERKKQNEKQQQGNGSTFIYQRSSWYSPVSSITSPRLVAPAATEALIDRNKTWTGEARSGINNPNAAVSHGHQHLYGNAPAGVGGVSSNTAGFQMMNYYFGMNAKKSSQRSPYFSALPLQMPDKDQKQLNFSNYFSGSSAEENPSLYMYKYFSPDQAMIGQNGGVQHSLGRPILPNHAPSDNQSIPFIGENSSSKRKIGGVATTQQGFQRCRSNERLPSEIKTHSSEKQKHEENSKRRKGATEERKPEDGQDLSLKTISKSQGTWKTKTKKKVVKKVKREQSSKYRGVCWHKRYKSWVSRLSVNGKSMHLGIFENEIAAALAVDKKLISLYGEKASKLNFPDPDVRKKLKEQLLKNPKQVQV